jgi:DNA-binding NarL/FixJ family response regulator
LTALLLYLHEIKEEDERSAGGAPMPEVRRDMVERALHETERLCGIMERMGNSFEAPTEADAAVTRGRESINWWAQSGHAKGNGLSPSPSAQQLLTPREREVLALITAGTSNKEGGHLLGISTRTFEVHRAHIMAKLGARNAADLVRVALSEG